jgi:cation diffusion facilitator CzcD-associated flavoprotein CzcO
MTRYCVIGAGAAGVSAVHQLRAAGYNVDCFERLIASVATGTPTTTHCT